MYEYKRQDVYALAAAMGARTKEKGDELFFRLCPKCGGGSGKDKDTFSVNLNTGAFKCFRASCDYHGHFVELARDFDFPLEDERQKQYRTLPQRPITAKPAAVRYLESRGIPEEITRRYRISIRSDADNVLVFPFYDEKNVLRFVKYRKTDFDPRFDKNKEWCEKDTMPILFGMDCCVDFGTLVITEGQLDSLSLAAAGIPNAVSVPTGALGFTWLSHCWEWINKFSEIVVFGDCEHGKITLIDTLEKRLAKKIRCVRTEDYLHEKDANDILRKYGTDALRKAVANAAVRDVRFVKRLADVESVNLRDLPKIRTGIPQLDRVCGGILFGHVTLLSGKRGEGKSTFLSQLVATALDQSCNTFIYSGELPNYHFKNWLDLQIAGGDHIRCVRNEFGDNEYYLDAETAQKIGDWYRDRAYIFDNSAVTDDDFDGLLSVITDAICRYDIRLVCIDNLMTAMDDDPGTDIYRQQSAFVKQLERLAQQYDVAVILVAHPKKSNQAFDNDTVSGSSDITNAVSFVWNYQRAKTNDEQSSDLMVTKNRMNGRLLTGEKAIPLYYSEATKRITANPYEKKICGCFAQMPSGEDLAYGLPI